jgi:hypothetical protein
MSRQSPLGGLDVLGDYPPVFPDLAVAGETRLFVGGERTVVEEPGGDRRGVLGVSLDPAPAEPGDQIQCTGEAGRGRTLAAVPLADVAARDPPIREFGDPLLVGRAVLDPGQLLGVAELAPADARVSVEDEGRVRAASSAASPPARAPGDG